MVACAISAAPREACGLLVSDADTDRGGSGQMLEYVPALNLSAGYLDYSIDPETQRRYVGKILGVFHSHVARDAVPSDDDSRLAVDGLLYVIYSLHDREFRAWRWEGFYEGVARWKVVERSELFGDPWEYPGMMGRVPGKSSVAGSVDLVVTDDPEQEAAKGWNSLG